MAQKSTHKGRKASGRTSRTTSARRNTPKSSKFFRKPWERNLGRDLADDFHGRVGFGGVLLAVAIAVVSVLGMQYIVSKIGAIPEATSGETTTADTTTVGVTVGEALGFRAFDVTNRSGNGTLNSPYVDPEGEANFRIIAGGEGVMAIYNTTDGKHDLLTRVVAKPNADLATYSRNLSAPYGAHEYKITAEFYRLKGNPSADEIKNVTNDGLIPIPANSPLIGDFIDSRSLEIKYDPSAAFLGLAWWIWIIIGLVSFIIVLFILNRIHVHRLKKMLKNNKGTSKGRTNRKK
jgi:hypothetical protein